MLRDPERYRKVQEQRSSLGGLRALGAATRQAMKEIRREKRLEQLRLHPKKKQPRHVRVAQPMKSLNPHGK